LIDHADDFVVVFVVVFLLVQLYDELPWPHFAAALVEVGFNVVVVVFFVVGPIQPATRMNLKPTIATRTEVVSGSMHKTLFEDNSTRYFSQSHPLPDL
jgi:hypothetical protein